MDHNFNSSTVSWSNYYNKTQLFRQTLVWTVIGDQPTCCSVLRYKMFFQYYTIQKVILKTEGTQEQDREEKSAKASKEEKNEDAKTIECEEEEIVDLKKKNKNPYEDFLNAIGDGEEVSCHWSIGH